jgi:putative zinc finger protein
MSCAECLTLLHEYVDGELSPELQAAVDRHLRGCDSCRQELARLKSLLAEAASLPKSIEPDHDLWEGIVSGIGTGEREGDSVPFKPVYGEDRDSLLLRLPVRGREGPSRLKIVFAAAAVILVLGFAWYFRSLSNGAWNIVKVAGTPVLNSQTLTGEAQIRSGGSVQTDGLSRARINIGSIGRMDVEPSTRVRLLSTKADDHRLALDLGAVVVSTWAPPRLVVVETPSANAIDLGCAYRLMVDSSGNTTLLVTAGYVALQWNGRESIVPAAAFCETRTGYGPGTPYSEQTSPVFRTELERFDFEHGGAESVNQLLAAAQKTDGVTLWHLLSRADPEMRPRLYARLASLIPPPAGVTEEGILRLERQMLSRWWSEFEPTPLP